MNTEAIPEAWAPPTNVVADAQASTIGRLTWARQDVLDDVYNELQVAVRAPVHPLFGRILAYLDRRRKPENGRGKGPWDRSESHQTLKTSRFGTSLSAEILTHSKLLTVQGIGGPLGLPGSDSS